MKNTFSKVIALLSEEERNQAYRLFGLVLVMAFLEVAGVVSILPFIKVVSEPEIVTQNQYFSDVYQSLNFSSTTVFLYFLGAIVFAFTVFAISFKAFTIYKLINFAELRSYSLGRRMVEGYLGQPYDWFLNRHSADLGKTILSEVQQVIGGALVPMMHLISQTIVTIVLLSLLIYVDPLLTLKVISVLGFFYAIVYLSLRNYLKLIGVERVKANQQRYQIVQEIFGGIKDVKVKGLETELLGRFEEPARNYAQRQAASQIVSQLPRYALETISIGGIMLIVLFLMAEFGGVEKALPVIVLYVFVGYRLMPSLQTIYSQLSILRFSGPALDTLHSDLTQYASDGSWISSPEPDTKLLIKNSLKLDGVTYTYPGSDCPIINNLSIEVPVNTTVGLVGVTGAGKTTTVDLLLGLLEPQKGRFFVDDTVISKDNIRSWQHNLGYVPQHVYLADDTISANIAFGVPADQVDQDAVERAARIAALHDFVSKELPDGYAALVGERGVRLSGGQRQRIGIARALYHDPDVLILDEATSALDNLTESAVMDAVNNIGHKKTTILIAHRLSTVRNCDQIFLLDKGQLLDQGNYQELIDKNEKFRAMASGQN